MASTPEILRSVKAILESGQKGREFEVTTALQMMSLASGQKVQKMQMAEAQLKRLEVTNLQVMHSQAQGFVNLTGFNQWYNPEDDEWAKKMVTDLTEEVDIEDGVNTGGFGFNELDAWRIAGAVQAFQLKEPGSILEIARELSSKADTGIQDSFVKGFYNTGMFSETKREITYQHLANINKTLSNREMIAEESYEFGTGDFDITRDIRMADIVTIPTGDPEDDFDDNLATSNAIQGVFTNDIQKVLDDLEQDKSKGIQLKNKFKNLKIAIATANARQRGGLDLTPTQESLLQDEGDALGLVEDEIRNLNISIEEKRTEGKRLSVLNAEESIRSGEITSGPGILHFGIDPIEKFNLWFQTGVWPSEEVFAASEAIKKEKVLRRMEGIRKDFKMPSLSIK
jgi:hypothetical protein